MTKISIIWLIFRHFSKKYRLFEDDTDTQKRLLVLLPTNTSVHHY